MKSLYYENQGRNTFLVYEVGADDEIDTMSLGMLTNNTINGIATIVFTQMDDKKFLKFNVSAKVSIKQFFAGTVNKRRIVGVFSGIVNAMLSAEDYMLDSDFILDLDYIFTDVSTCKTELICLPLIKKVHDKVDLGAFFRNIMFSTQFDQTENCDYIAKIINHLNAAPLLVLSDFKKLLEDIELQKDSTTNNSQVKSHSIANASNRVNTISKQPSLVSNIDKNSDITHTVKDTIINKFKQSEPTIQPSVQNNKEFSVPSSVQAQSSAQNTKKATSKEDKISLFYLMQHYSKETAAAYKAQKKSNEAVTLNATTVEKKSKKFEKVKKSNASSKNNEVSSFTIPNKSNEVDFAVPRENFQTPAPVNSVANSNVKINNQAAPQIKFVQQPAVTQAVSKPQPQLVNPAASPAYAPRETFQSMNISFGETTVLSAGGAIGETTVLAMGQGQKPTILPHLIRIKNNEKISLDKPVFRVGKERSYVDYFIGDNTAISRSHANFITRDETFFVMDTNSTNHTFLNGQMIKSNEEVPLVNGDIVRLAQEDFEFKLY